MTALQNLFNRTPFSLEIQQPDGNYLTPTDKSARKESLYLLAFRRDCLLKLQGSQSASHALVELSPMPKPTRGNFRMTACGSKMYVIGGYENASEQASNIVQQYDTQTGWQDWSPMLEKRTSCGAAAQGGRLFTVGGNDGKRALSSAEECDLQTGRWAHMAFMTVARNGVGMAALGNLFFAVGGSDGKSCLNSAEWYDSRTGRWTKAVPMHEPRWYFGCAALGDRLYVAGGCTCNQKWTASVEWLDLRIGRWTRVRDMSAARGDFTLAALNGQLLAAGGYSSGGTLLNTVEVYDEKGDAWRTLDVGLPHSGGACAGCVIEE